MPTGEHIQDWLEGHERSQSWLARRVGISRSYLTRLFNGERPLSDDLARSIAEVLDVPADWVKPGIGKAA